MPDAPMLLDIPLTGGRNYLHGADIFDAVVARTGATSDVQLVLKTAGDCAIDLADPDAGEDSGAEVFGAVRYRVGDDTRRRVLRRWRARPVTVRVPLDEESVAAGAVLSADGATVPAGAASFMRRAVALAVLFLERDHPDDHWGLAEIGCGPIPPEGTAVDLALEPRLGGRYWKAIAAPAGGAPIGTLVLSRGMLRR